MKISSYDVKTEDKRKVSDIIADFLVEHGIKHNFTVVGGGAMHLNDSFGHKNGLHNVYCNHEQACAMAAEAYARLTGNIACLCVTSGPGGTNAITGVLGGWLDSIPMLVLSGQVKTQLCIRNLKDSGLRQLGDQEFDIVGVAERFTKYCVMVTDPTDIIYHLEKALFISKIGKNGPVWLDIPLDIQGAQVNPVDLRHFDEKEEGYADNVCFSQKDAEKLLNIISNAQAPLLMVGSAVQYSRSADSFLQLVNKLKIPVVAAWAANDIIAYEHSNFIGIPGTLGTRAGNFAVQNCDVLLSLGSRMNVRTVGYNKGNFAKNAYKMMVDICADELKKPTYEPDWGICADVKEVIAALLYCDYQVNDAHKKWSDWCRKLKERYAVVLPQYHNSNRNINPYVFTEQLFDYAANTDVMVCSNGSACVIPIQVGKIKKGQRLICNSGCAAMGYGLPAAMGAAFAMPNRRILCMEGDGSLMMNLQELATARYYHLNIKIFIYNNNGYHSIRQTQNNNFGGAYAGVNGESGVALPSYKAIAQAFDIPYRRIQFENCSIEIIRETLNTDGICICEVFVDETQNFAPKSSAKVLDDGSIVSPSIDDMSPFLSVDEYSSICYFKKEKED